MPFHITSLYAVILTLVAIVLSNIISIKRGKANISILHGNDMNLAIWIRRHGNFVESVPLAIILMGLSEGAGASRIWLHAIGLTLVASRLLHVAGLDATNAKNPLRIAGGVGTQLAMLGAAGFILWAELR
jgi:uncharacterized protein